MPDAVTVPECDGTTREMLRTHALNGAQRQANGSTDYADNLRYNYLQIKDQPSIIESIALQKTDTSKVAQELGQLKAILMQPPVTVEQNSTKGP